MALVTNDAVTRWRAITIVSKVVCLRAKCKPSKYNNYENRTNIYLAKTFEPICRFPELKQITRN